MWQLVCCLFIIPPCIFLGFMKREPRTLWSGALFLVMMMCLAGASVLALLFNGSITKMAENGVLIVILVALLWQCILFPPFLI